MIFVYLFLFAFIYKFVSNFIYMKQIQKYRTLHEKWLQKRDEKFYIYRNSIINLFNKAHLQKTTVPVSQTQGNYQKRFKLDPYVNFPSNITAVVKIHLALYDLAESVFYSRLKDAISPLYWIDLILFAPKKLLAHLNLNNEKNTTKLLNILLTFIWWLAVATFPFFKQDLKIMIINLLEIYF